jgi:hypothetical protein
MASASETRARARQSRIGPDLHPLSPYRSPGTLTPSPTNRAPPFSGSGDGSKPGPGPRPPRDRTISDMNRFVNPESIGVTRGLADRSSRIVSRASAANATRSRSCTIRRSAPEIALSWRRIASLGVRSSQWGVQEHRLGFRASHAREKARGSVLRAIREHGLRRMSRRNDPWCPEDDSPACSRSLRHPRGSIASSREGMELTSGSGSDARTSARVRRF